MAAKYYKNIQGWFDFEKFYEARVKSANDGDIFVEVGVWKGRSAVFMAETIKESGKKIKFYGVDPFTGSLEHQDEIKTMPRPLIEVTKANIVMADVADYIELIADNSVNAAKDFADNSLAFVFIDADHTYECVKNDINAWWPKIKKGGILAGHDYGEDWGGVRMAVDEWVPANKLHLDIYGACWVVRRSQ